MSGPAHQRSAALQMVQVLTMPRLLLRALPWVVGAVGVKAILQAAGVHPLDLNPLFSGLVGANVFLLGFLLAGTLSDYKESERLPAELAGSLETIADEALLVHAEHGVPEGAACIEQCADIAASIRTFIVDDVPVDEPLVAIRAFNPLFSVFGPLIQPGFTTRLKGEQAQIRRVVLRIHTIRTTSFVAAGYAIAELTGALLVIGLELSRLSDHEVESLFFIGVITLLLTYVFLLIRAVDTPFEYEGSRPGSADISLQPLVDAEARLRAEHAAIASASAT